MDNDGGVGWIIGDGVTYADIVVFHYCDYILNLCVGGCVLLISSYIMVVLVLPSAALARTA